MAPLRLGLFATLLASIAYEPLRWLTTMFRPSLDEALGGVGGVGGLANMNGPYANCSTTVGGVRAPYCFYPGLVFGLTPFALVVLVVWVSPLALGALAASAKKCGTTLATTSTATASRSLYCAWVLMNTAWFALPLAQYCFLDPFLDRSFWSRLLAVSIAAAYPLSWNLSLVAIPSSGARYLPPLLAVSREELVSAHKAVARSCLFWAFLHGSRVRMPPLAMPHLGCSTAPRAFGGNNWVLEFVVVATSTKPPIPPPTTTQARQRPARIPLQHRQASRPVLPIQGGKLALLLWRAHPRASARTRHARGPPPAPRHRPTVSRSPSRHCVGRLALRRGSLVALRAPAVPGGGGRRDRRRCGGAGARP